MRIETVFLFDLDGTLVDSAPDLAGAANRLRAEHGLPPLPYEDLRPMVGSGARGMVGVAFGVRPGDSRFEQLRDAFLDRYETGLLERTRPFDGVEGLLAALEAAGLPWGIVTNKATRFTRLIRLLIASVGPFETRDRCQAAIWWRQRTMVRPSCWISGGHESSWRSWPSRSTNSAARSGSSMS